MLRPSRRSWATAIAAMALVCFAPGTQARETGASPTPTLSTVALSALPREAQNTHRLILAGGPFPHGKDGSVFGNRERLLPRKARGYYREYTVRTPGSRDSGARRLVCGGEPPVKPEVCYYTDDHYASFKQVVQ